jgi:hypothetical protein
MHVQARLLQLRRHRQQIDRHRLAHWINGGAAMTTDRDATSRSEEERQSDYMRGGKGRKDEVGGSGIYPASSPDAPGDAEIRSEGNLVGYGRSPRRHPDDERDSKKNQSWGSE